MGLPAFRHFIEHELGKFPHFVLYAFLEWTLLALLFVEGLVAFVAYEFAKIFDLRTPCSLCTRIDHVLVRRDSDFYYNDAMCEDHKRDVSSLAYCHVHGKLSDIRNMCEGCLLSFSTDAKSSDPTTESLECLFDDGLRARLKMPYWVKDDASAHQSGGEKGKKDGSGYFCSCCGEAMKVKSSYHKGSNNLDRNNNRLTQAPAPSPRAFVPWRNDETRNLELPHVKYTELRLSDTSSPADEDGTDNITLPGKEDPKAAAMPLLAEPDEVIEEPYKSTPTYARGGSNKLFGIPLTDSATASPRWTSRVPRKSLLDRAELALQDPVEACCTNDGDTDTILNRLKRQVRLDRKSLVALYMELDEERSASAVAANNAMAMITRLQAEKAAVQMDALQYQRMMEEQAEYDQEALQALREMLDKREVEIRELEDEVGLYRERYGIIVRDVISSDHRGRGRGGQDDGFEVKSCSVYSTERSERGSPRISVEGTETDAENERQERGFSHHRVDRLGSISFDFERERSYLLGQLRMLESKMFHTSLTGAASSDSSITDTKTETESQVSPSEDTGADDRPEHPTSSPITETGADHLGNGTMGTEITASALPPHTVEPEVPHASSPADDDASEITYSNYEEDHKAEANGSSSYNNVSISAEVSQLGRKLRALEEDGRFLKRAFLTLEKGGNDGSKLLGEIVFHLRKLRDMEKVQMISVL